MRRDFYLLAAGLLWAGLTVTSALAGDGCGAGACADVPACGAGGACAAAACGARGCDGGAGCRHCRHCGSGDGCLVCRLVPTEKTIKVNCFAAECKPLCIPCPSHKECRHVDCVDCSKNCGCCDKKVVWFSWCPGDAKMKSPKHLMKKTVEHKVPSYKWVVENLCEGCQTECEQQSVPAPKDAPPPPKVGAKILYGVPAATDSAALY